MRFEKPLRQKTLFLPRNFGGKGSKNRRQNREERHEETRPNSTFAASFFCPSSISGKGPSSKTISRKTRFDNWSLQSSDETLRKPIFLENPNSRPHYRTPAGPIIEPMNRKIWPHYRSLQHIYIYIYIYRALALTVIFVLSPYIQIYHYLPFCFPHNLEAAMITKSIPQKFLCVTSCACNSKLFSSEVVLCTEVGALHGTFDPYSQSLRDPLQE